MSPTLAHHYDSRGSLWYRWDLHFHTPASFDYEDKSVTNQQIVDRLIDRRYPRSRYHRSSYNGCAAHPGASVDSVMTVSLCYLGLSCATTMVETLFITFASSARTAILTTSGLPCRVAWDSPTRQFRTRAAMTEVYVPIRGGSGRSKKTRRSSFYSCRHQDQFYRGHQKQRAVSATHKIGHHPRLGGPDGDRPNQGHRCAFEYHLPRY